MKKHCITLLLVALTASIIPTPVRAAEKPEAGKDRIDTPAIGTGLCVHNLFQSNYEIYTGKKTKTAGVLDRAENRELVQALQAEDLKRQIEDAKTLLKANNFHIQKR